MQYEGNELRGVERSDRTAEDSKTKRGSGRAIEPYSRTLKQNLLAKLRQMGV